MSVEVYIVASCKKWHSQGFDDLASVVPGNWLMAETPEELKGQLVAAKPRYIFFLHWSWIVPEEIWGQYECVCFHMTDVPFGRGGSPLQNLIVRGFKSTKLSALRMVAELDAGPVYTKRDMVLSGSAEEIYLRASLISFEIIRWMVERNPLPTEQSGEVVTFERRKPDQSALPNGSDLESLYDYIRMLDAEGYPNAFLQHGKFRIEFRSAEFDGEMISASVLIKPVRE
ncbi:methionyl-tRNA formyltransferase [Seongchinamella sediminis]|uniref:Methionyl-tRNA formyltransferase n=1 Tax=Seongchinamella sediminis TaxID=2283635 RepID=A0A3L7DXC8_9GAMM|nr:methionyl-tRNA formyltransferase [Seongchinamella sediminis]RLQ22217.1 methionyl-tRNA formyltransferase [Seongchinamella sediminis]